MSNHHKESRNTQNKTQVHLVGVRTVALQGDDLATKMEKLNSISTLDGLLELAQRDGFATTLSAGSMIAIPAGLLVTTAVSDKEDGMATVVRYSFMTSDDLTVCHTMLKDMMHAFDYLAGTDYGTVKQLMEASFKHKS